jgi:hypothetical protein
LSPDLSQQALGEFLDRCSLTTRDVFQCGQKWLATFTPFITDNNGN